MRRLSGRQKSILEQRQTILEQNIDLVLSRMARAVKTCNWEKWDALELDLAGVLTIETEREVADYPALMHLFKQYDPSGYQDYQRLRRRMDKCPDKTEVLIQTIGGRR